MSNGREDGEGSAGQVRPNARMRVASLGGSLVAIQTWDVVRLGVIGVAVWWTLSEKHMQVWHAHEFC